MADLSTCPPLTRASVQTAHEAIKQYIHRTPVMTNTTISDIASTPQTPEALKGTEYEGQTPAKPKIRLFFKCENYQKIGAFKARGAFHALSRLDKEIGFEEVRKRGVVTHSSGNHAQALALAARTHNIPAHIVMPTISTSSKIAGTKSYGARVIFSGSTAPEREAVVADVQAKTGAILVPPYNHPDILLGQGTLALELQEQVEQDEHTALDAVIAPCGGGGMLSGVATALSGTGIKVFAAEPSFEGADDLKRGLKEGKLVEKVSTLTIADGLRTPVGPIPWSVISDKTKVAGAFSVGEEQIKAAMKLLLERAKIFVEPSAAVPLAVALFDEEFRRIVEVEGGEKGWNVGIVLSGGNTTVEAIAKLFEPKTEKEAERQEGVVGINGEKIAENVAG